jgi:glycosyltransferase involved in cell wall biosynthesis
VRYAGSEQCVEEMLRVFPDARLLTTLLSPEAMPPLLRGAEPSFLQFIPGATSRHEWFLPLMPAAWRIRTIRDVDAVISSSHACANAVRTEPGIPHLSYCHTPMRYAWDFAAEAARFPTVVRPAARVLMSSFRRWDRKTAARITQFLANSSEVAARIERFYGRRAHVVHPPVRTDYFTPEGERQDFFLFVGRLVPYKRPDLAIESVRGLPPELLVVGEGLADTELRKSAPTNVRFLGGVPDEELRRLYRAARAVIAPGVEDFGIAMAEAQACGTPVIAPAHGGALDIVVDGSTGWLLDRPDLEAFRKAVQAAARQDLDADEISKRAQRFSSSRFREEIRSEVEAAVRAT